MKIKSMELPSGQIANFLNNGNVEIVDMEDKIILHESNLRTILDILKQNSKSNGVVEVNKEPVKS